MRIDYELLKILKLLGVAVLFSGTVGAVLPRSLEDRRRAAYFLAGPGFGVTWIAGFLLAIRQQRPLLSWWSITAIVLSLFSLQVVLFSVGIDGRRSGVVAALAIAPLVGCVAAMVLRSHG